MCIMTTLLTLTDTTTNNIINNDNNSNNSHSNKVSITAMTEATITLVHRERAVSSISYHHSHLSFKYAFMRLHPEPMSSMTVKSMTPFTKANT